MSKKVVFLAIKIKKMKKENNDIIGDFIPHRFMTDAEKAQSDLLSEKSFFKARYRLALKLTTQLKIEEYAKTQPDWTSKDVLMAILKGYNAQLPSAIMLEMTQLIVHEWDTILANRDELVYA